MGIKLKKIKINDPNTFGRLPQKIDYKKPKIINILNSTNINQNKIPISDHHNQKPRIEIEHLKINGIMYSNISRFR